MTNSHVLKHEERHAPTAANETESTRTHTHTYTHNCTTRSTRSRGRRGGREVRGAGAGPARGRGGGGGGGGGGLPAYLSSSSRPSKTLTTQPHESNRSMTSWMLKPKAGRTQ